MESDDGLDTSSWLFTPRKRDTRRKYEEDHTGADNLRFRNMTEVQNTLGIDTKGLQDYYKVIRVWFEEHPDVVINHVRKDEEQKSVHH